jgi:hypothetical protein
MNTDLPTAQRVLGGLIGLLGEHPHLVHGASGEPGQLAQLVPCLSKVRQICLTFVTTTKTLPLPRLLSQQRLELQYQLRPLIRLQVAPVQLTCNGCK